MIAVFTSDSNEIQVLLHKVEILCTEKIGPATLYTAELNHKKFLIVDTAWCKVNLGAAVGAVTALHHVDKIIGLGNCGVLATRGPAPGYVGISETSRQYDVDFSALGYEPSLIIGLSQPQYPCDEALIALAEEQACALCIPSYHALFGSADRFLANGTEFYSLSQQFGMDTVDTETGCLGEFAFETGIPYVYVKGVSNYGDDNAPQMYAQYYEEANALACHVVYHMLDVLTGGSGACPCNGKDRLSIHVDLNRAKALTACENLMVIRACDFTILSMASCHGMPYAVPMGFSFHEHHCKQYFCLYSHHTGEKMEMMKESSHVCLTFVKEGKDGMYSVVVNGTVKILPTDYHIACNKHLATLCIAVDCMSGRKYPLCRKCPCEEQPYEEEAAPATAEETADAQ